MGPSETLKRLSCLHYGESKLEWMAVPQVRRFGHALRDGTKQWSNPFDVLG